MRDVMRGGHLHPVDDPDVTVHMLAGSYFAELALTGQVRDDWAQRTVDQLASNADR